MVYILDVDFAINFLGYGKYMTNYMSNDIYNLLVSLDGKFELIEEA